MLHNGMPYAQSGLQFASPVIVDCALLQARGEKHPDFKVGLAFLLDKSRKTLTCDQWGKGDQ